MRSLPQKKKKRTYVDEFWSIFAPEKYDFNTYKGFFVKKLTPPYIAKFLQKVLADSQNIKGFLNICTFVSSPMIFLW
jgi:hypothetical protein